jgi:hypothetical protein
MRSTGRRGATCAVADTADRRRLTDEEAFDLGTAIADRN